jgi:hypothetical protein
MKVSEQATDFGQLENYRAWRAIQHRATAIARFAGFANALALILGFRFALPQALC